MKILKIYDGDYPWDVRVEKMLRSLSDAGQEVTLVARNRQGRARRERLEDPPGVLVRRLPPWGGLADRLTLPFFASPLWIHEARAAARALRPDRILVRDLPLAPLGLALGRRVGCPVIVDMAEPYPLALRSNWEFDALGGLDHVLRSPRLAGLVERRVLRQRPRVLVVSEEAGERLERLGLPRERWTLVSNTPDLARMPPAEPGAAPWPADLAGRRILLFTGILVGDRGLDVAIQGLARLLEERGPVAALVVAGDGPARARFEAKAARCGVADAVRFLGWTAHDALPTLWRAADVGVLPFRSCPHIETTLANKLFDYMAVGLPILASDARPMARVLRETSAGLTFRADDPEDFARVLGRMLDRPAAMREMGTRGAKACRESHSWAHDAARLLEAVARP